MKPKTIVILVSIAVVGILAALWAGGAYNTAASLKNNYEMKVKANMGEFDNTVKIIAQTFQIAESKKDGLKEVLIGYASGRTPNENAGSVFNWIKEHSPVVDLKVYDNAQNIIVASRNGWTARQTELVGIAEEYNKNLVVMPRGLVLKLFGFTHIDPKVITSSRTEKAFETSKDDDISLTPKK